MRRSPSSAGPAAAPQARRSAMISSTSAASMARRISGRGSRSVTKRSTLTRSHTLASAVRTIYCESASVSGCTRSPIAALKLPRSSRRSSPISPPASCIPLPTTFLTCLHDCPRQMASLRPRLACSRTGIVPGNDDTHTAATMSIDGLFYLSASRPPTTRATPRSRNRHGVGTLPAPGDHGALRGGHRPRLLPAGCGVSKLEKGAPVPRTGCVLGTG